MTTIRLVGSNVVHVKACEDRPLWLRRHAETVRRGTPAVLSRQLADLRAQAPEQPVAKKAAA